MNDYGYAKAAVPPAMCGTLDSEAVKQIAAVLAYGSQGYGGITEVAYRVGNRVTNIIYREIETETRRIT